MAGGFGSVHRQRRCLGAVLRRPGAWLRVSEHRVSDQRRLRWSSPGQQPVLRLAHMPRHQDRQDDLVPAARAPRHLGLRHASASDPRRPHRRWEAGQGGRAAHQAGVRVRVRPHERAAGWPWVERPVPQTDVPGEWTAPTQPFPNKPPAFDQQGITHDDLIDFTPALRAEAIKALEQYKIGPIYTPGTVVVEGKNQGTIVVPGLGGGANWPAAPPIRRQDSCTSAPRRRRE